MKIRNEDMTINVSGTVKSLRPGDTVTFTAEQAKRTYLYTLCSQLRELGMRYSVNKVAEGRYRVTRYE